MFVSLRALCVENVYFVLNTGLHSYHSNETFLEHENWFNL